MTLPSAPHQLNRMLAVRLSAAAVVIGVVAGGVAYLIESRRAEQAALEDVVEVVRHFESPAMRVLSGAGSSAEHGPLADLFQKSNLVGLRVFASAEEPVYETWGDLSAEAKAIVIGLPLQRPAFGADVRERFQAGSEQLIRIAVPLLREPGRPMGHLEGVYRVDKKTLATWRQQILDSILTAVASVFATAVLLYPLLLALLRHATRLSSSLLESNLSLLNALGNAVAKRDSDTDAHNYRVTLYAVALAEALHLPRREITHLIAGAFLHDVGKIGIADRILLKPGKLSDEEFAVMKTHSLLGLEIVAGNAWMVRAAAVIRHHHERFDGSGYPDGLAGKAIPRNARLFAVVDVFDALTSARPYKEPIPPGEALALIERGSGSHFDPQIVVAFRMIALALHAAVVQDGDAELRVKLRAVLSRYFRPELLYGEPEAAEPPV